MNITDFYDPIRSILGDREVHGMWNYSDTTLASAVKTLFKVGRAPQGYVLDGVGGTITPDVQAGNDYALICYDAALLLIGGEDGAIAYRTRVISVHDQGHRKRDLLSELRQLIYEIRDGAAIFTSTQSFIAFLGNTPASGDNVLGPAAEFTTMDLQTGIQHLAI